MKIEAISAGVIDDLVRLACTLWPDCSAEEEAEYFKGMLASDNATCFLVKEQEEYIAFIQLSLRTDYVEGTTTSPLAYVVGVYVQPEYRKSGIGRSLIARAEQWGKEKGCKEFASDVLLENQESIAFHKKVGLKEAGRIVCFVKALE